jgi:hypothetical protein
MDHPRKMKSGLLSWTRETWPMIAEQRRKWRQKVSIILEGLVEMRIREMGIIILQDIKSRFRVVLPARFVHGKHVLCSDGVNLDSELSKMSESSARPPHPN